MDTVESLNAAATGKEHGFPRGYLKIVAESERKKGTGCPDDVPCLYDAGRILLSLSFRTPWRRSLQERPQSLCTQLFVSHA